MNRFCPLCGKPWAKYEGEREGCDTFDCHNYHALEKTDRTVMPGYRTTRGRIAGGHVVSDRREWSYDQRTLAKQLGLGEVPKYLGRFCKVCGKPAPKFSRLDLCEAHRAEHLREGWRKRKRKQRAKVTR